ncbi:hypothetical protein [Streptomyces sp. NPDC092952]|uniref:hypothetical protein n=1 Tax=Streptomyces sp. NPDC092952 TaxID=3366018 RepID=UPI003806BD2A
MSHRAVAEAARAERGVWMLAGIYPSRMGGTSAARRIPLAQKMPSYEPAGAYEAYTAPARDDGWAVWIRYVAGAPKPEPRPATMTYRVCDRGSGRGYVGVHVVTVVVAAECPVCGGPRGMAVPHRFHEDGDWYVVDQWKNRCGHIDMYDDVLTEYRRRQAQIDEAVRKASAHTVGIGPADAGEYTDAVALLHAAASEIRGLHAKQAAQILDTRGHGEAARRVMEEMRDRSGHMSARQAALFLAELAAARAACTDCDHGRVNYRSGDGEFVSLRCRVCRRETVPSA